MADLFQTTKQNISQHLRTICEEGELRPEATVKKYLTVQTEGNREVSRTVDHYNLDAMLLPHSPPFSTRKERQLLKLKKQLTA